MDVLVLNQDYTPLHVISWQRAITEYFKGKVDIIEEYDGKVIRSVSISMKMPSVVRLVKWAKSKTRGVRFNKTNLYMRDHGKCQYCLQPVSQAKATYDHVKPRSQGGTTDWTNIVIACAPCNRRKDRHAPEEVGMHLHTKPIRPSSLPMQFGFSLRLSNHIPKEWRNWIVNVKLEE